MLRTYRGLLDAIVRRDYDVFSARVRLRPAAQALAGGPRVAGALGVAAC